MIRLALFLAAAVPLATVAAFAGEDSWARNLQCFEIIPGNPPIRLDRCNGETWRLIQTPNGASRWFPVIVEISEYTATKHRLPPMPVISDEPPKITSDSH